MSDEKKLLTYEDARITDPAMAIVTDEAVKAHLAELEIPVGAVDFKYDYSRDFPHSKMYQVNDPSSPHYKAHIVAISNLDMVNARGERCEPKWIDNGDGTFSAGPNQFEATVDGTAVTVVCINDQPDSRKEGESTTWNPVLKLDGAVVELVGGPNIIDDPLNEHYTGNVLEYDYGICKRRLRLIEGNILERWVFDKSPGGTIRIEHNFNGAPLRLGQFAVDDDTEVVLAEQWDKAEFPLEISASGTYYCGASHVDGYASMDEREDSWGDLRGGSGTHANTSPYTLYNYIETRNVSDKWWAMHRTIIVFDTTSLPSDGAITAATLSVYGSQKQNGFSSGSADVNIYSAAPASNNAIVAGDFDSLGSTAFSTAITLANWSVAGYNDFVLNSSGLANITKAGASKFGMRLATIDVGNSPPSWESGKNCHISGYSTINGASYKPKLVVTYTVAPSVTTNDATSVGETTATLNGNVTDTGGENPTRYFEYGKTTGYELGSINKGTGGVGAYSHNLTGLDADTTYYYRSKVTNSAGTGLGAQKSFKTLEAGGLNPGRARGRGRFIHGGSRNIF